MGLDHWISTPSGPTKPSSIIAVSSALPALCIIAVALRFYLRHIQKKTALKLDDWTVALALVFVIAMGAVGIIGVEHGVWGHNLPSNAADGPGEFEGKSLEAFQYIQIFALGLIKLSALAFYHRVFCIRGRWSAFDIFTYVSAIIVILWIIAMVIFNSLQCGTHITALWTGPEAYELYCADNPVFEDTFSITNFILDLFIVLLPLPKIYTLHTTAPRKLAVSAVFLLASVGVAASITRMAIYIELNLDLSYPDADIFLLDSLQVFWSNLEAGLCLLAVNLPSLWAYTTKVKVSPDGVLASIRSAISLRSTRSDTSQKMHPPATGEEARSISSESLQRQRSMADGKDDVEAQT